MGNFFKVRVVAPPLERASVITREEAVEVLTQLINSGILTYDIEEKLVDISNLIDLERVGYAESRKPL